jgi:hypothetical protein
MQTELRQLIKQSQFYKASVLRVAEMLPVDDAALNELIEETVRSASANEFIFIAMAALHAGRPVSARHLSRGGILMPNWFFMGWMATHMTGDLPEPLMDALESTQMALDIEATALFAIVVWCQKHRGGVLPDGLLPAARALARIKKTGAANEAVRIPTLRALAIMTGDTGLASVVQQIHGASNPAGVKFFIEENIRRFSRGAEVDILLDDRPKTLAAGTTMRRAVARTGRNERCPCGSGRKYKYCCHDKDQERLHHSSEVAGHTREEVHADPERHLTDARLEKMRSDELLQLDPRKISRELLPRYLMQLTGMSQFDRLAEAFEQVGCAEELIKVWSFVLFFVTRAGRKDVLERLIKVHPNAATIEGELDPGMRLLLAQDDPARFLRLLEELSLQSLQTEDSEALEKFADGIMTSKELRALGIFIARSMVPLVKQQEASRLYQEILETRDKLNLSPEDPFGDILDERFANHDEDESAQLRKARQNLEVKAQEVRELKESLAQLHKEISRREHKPVTNNPPSRITPAIDELALKELRKKVESLKSTLIDRHHERNTLRRGLQKAQDDLETIRQNAPAPSSEESEVPDHEEELLLPQDRPEVYPVRLIEFPKSFQQTLTGFPRHVARAAMSMIGRLAAGEPAAFVGALRLKVMPNVMRQRIGSDYRLLFRLHSDHLQVIDLINRKDLDRRLKTLV